jgi:acetoin utilization protein AcuB
MFVSDWMTKRVFTVGLDESVSDAIVLMKVREIKHIPVVKDGRLKGIISDRDIKEFTPSRATALEIYELHYLLAVTKVRDVMRNKVVTTSPDTPVEEAAMLMHDSGIGCLPVMSRGSIVGIISDRDIYRVLVDITGVRHGGHRICLTVEDRPGSVKEVADITRKYGFQLQSVLTSYEGVKEGYRDVVIRTKGTGDFRKLKAEIEKTYSNARIDKG